MVRAAVRKKTEPSSQGLLYMLLNAHSSEMYYKDVCKEKNVDCHKRNSLYIEKITFLDKTNRKSNTSK